MHGPELTVFYFQTIKILITLGPQDDKEYHWSVWTSCTLDDRSRKRQLFADSELVQDEIQSCGNILLLDKYKVPNN